MSGNITCIICLHRHPAHLTCEEAAQLAARDRLMQQIAQSVEAEARIRAALDEHVLQAFHQLQERGVGAIRIAVIHDEIIITQEDL
jgi:hypothetical protein